VRVSADRQQSSEVDSFGDPPLISDPRLSRTAHRATASNALTYSSRLNRPYFGGYQPLIGDWDHVYNIVRGRHAAPQTA